MNKRQVIILGHFRLKRDSFASITEAKSTKPKVSKIPKVFYWPIIIAMPDITLLFLSTQLLWGNIITLNVLYLYEEIIKTSVYVSVI